jgi:hypothetical protein
MSTERERLPGRRVRRILGWSAVGLFLASLAWQFFGAPVDCTRTTVTNAAGVSSAGPLSCPPPALAPLVLLAILVVAWLASLLWALRRRRRGEEPASTEVPVFPQG